MVCLYAMNRLPHAVTRGSTGRGLAARLLVLALLGAWPAMAEMGVWEPLGPLSGVVDAFAAAPTDALRLYAVQSVELVLRSDDGGVSWSPILDAEPWGVADLAVAPSDPDVVYVGLSNGSILRSGDGGDTWAERGPVPDHLPVRALTVGPSDPDHVLANGGFDHVFHSTDGAATWSQPAIEGMIPFAVAFAFDPVEPSTVYVATSWDYDRSFDGGATWTQVGEAGHVIYGLVAHPSEAGVLFAATDLGIERSADGGETWSRLGGETGPGFCQTVAVAPWDGDRLLASCFTHLWTSTDGGATWRPAPTPLADSSARRIEAVGEGPGTLYLLTGSGIVASFDGGAAWTLRTPRLGRASGGGRLLTPPRARNRVFLGTLEGLFVSDPPWGGWKFLEAVGATAVYDLAAERHSNRIYAATSRGLLASEDGGNTWTDIAPGMQVRWLTVDPLHRGTLYAWDRSLGLFRTTDGGQTWTRRGRYIRNCLTSIEAHPTAEDTFVGTATCCSHETPRPCGGVFLTQDGWATRRRIFEGYAADVALRPPKTIFLGTADGVYRSTDLGKTWALVSDEVDAGTVTEVLIDPVDPRVVYAGTSHLLNAGTANLIVSEDGGETWAPYDEGLPDDVITDLAIDPRRPWFLYATVSQHAVWRLQRREVPLPTGPGERPLRPLD